jgi:hypothetical protein
MASSDIWYNEQGLWVRKAPHEKRVLTVYNGLRLTAVLEKKRGTYGDDPTVEIR